MFRFGDPGPVFQKDKSRLSEYLPDLVCLSSGSDGNEDDRRGI